MHRPRGGMSQARVQGRIKVEHREPRQSGLGPDPVRLPDGGGGLGFVQRAALGSRLSRTGEVVLEGRVGDFWGSSDFLGARPQSNCAVEP